MNLPYLSAADRDFYRKEGYLVVDPLFPDPLLAQAREDIYALLERKRQTLSPADRRTRETESDLHTKSQAVRELITSEVFAGIGGDLLGDEIDLRCCFTLTKTPEHGGPVDWHQDWGLGKDPGYPWFTFWIAITDATLGNGCLQVLPGSHTSGLRPHAVSATSPPDLGIRDIDAEGARPLEMKSGQALLLHPQVIHGRAGPAFPRTPGSRSWPAIRSPRGAMMPFGRKPGRSS